MRDPGGVLTHMIQLTRLNGSPLAVNCDLIKYAEAAPDTDLTLVTGEKLIVLEPCSEVSPLTLECRASIQRKAGPEPAQALVAKSVHDAEQIARNHDRKPPQE